MRIFRFDKSVGKCITQFDSHFVMSRILSTEKPAHVGCMYLEANDIIGFHQAVSPQLLLVVHGDGFVRGNSEERVHVTAGDAVFWESGEGHETVSETGLTAIVIESEELIPSLFMKQKGSI